MRHAMNIGFAIALCMATSSAVAETDCNAVPEAMKARCQEAARIKAACAGLEGDALKTCQQKNASYARMKDDCSKLEGEARTRCETHNRAMDKSATCAGKTGPELESCIR